ncbi:MAG TPA: aminoacyl-tRNA hydrolase, partial [Phycisphaerae bacterium]
KPTTFMNRSGQAVIAAVNFYRIEQADLLVVSDDHALPIGRLRFRAEGSAGGHNGLQDTVERLGTDQFARLRIGIGPPVGSWVDFVLTPFAPDEQPQIEKVLAQAADGVECWVNEGIDAAMNVFNADQNPAC